MSEPITERNLIVEVLRGAPSWITPAVVEDTLKTFRPYYGESLSPGDALEMLLRMGRLFELLEEKPHQKRPS
jgi:hypothetical protein